MTTLVVLVLIAWLIVCAVLIQGLVMNYTGWRWTVNKDPQSGPSRQVGLNVYCNRRERYLEIIVAGWAVFYSFEAVDRSPYRR